MEDVGKKHNLIPVRIILQKLTPKEITALSCPRLQKLPKSVQVIKVEEEVPFEKPKKVAIIPKLIGITKKVAKPNGTKEAGVQTEELTDLQKYMHFCCFHCEYKSKESSDFRAHLDENHNFVNEEKDGHEHNEDHFESFFDDFHTEEAKDGISSNSLNDCCGDKNEEDLYTFDINPEVKCFKCDITFKSKLVQDLVHHVDLSHNEAKSYRCQDYHDVQCDFFTRTRVAFKKHLKSHMKDSNVKKEDLCKSQCLKCGQESEDMITHVNACLDSKEGGINGCKLCVEQFGGLNRQPLEEFQAHYDSTHSPVKPNVKKKAAKPLYNCSICDGLPIKNVRELKAHLMQFHLHESKFCCKDFSNDPNCQVSKAKLVMITKHIAKEHKKPPRHTREKKPNPEDYKNILLMCPLCDDVQFKYLNAILNHVRSIHHDHTDPFVCRDFCQFRLSEDAEFANDCEKPFQHPAALIEHLKLHQEESQVNIKYTCGECGKIFDSLKQQSRHVKRVHLKLGAKSRSYKAAPECPCHICGKVIKGSVELQQHIMAIHEKIYPHVCDKCGKSFVRVGKLNEHIRAVHEQRRTYKCSQCDMTFNWSAVLRRHEESVHANSKDWICDQCTYSGTSRENLIAHVRRIHSHGDRYECGFTSEGKTCLTFFPTKYSLSAHRKVHMKEMGKPFRCGLCPRAFGSQARLKMHTGDMHPQKSELAIECPECLKMYPGIVTMKMHLKRAHPHVQKKQFCHICPEQFFFAHELVDHYAKRHGEGSVECDECGKHFAKNLDLQCHKNVKHRNGLSKKAKKAKRASKKKQKLDLENAGFIF